MRQGPSFEVDAIWETHELMDVISISRDDAIDLEKDLDKAVTLDDRFGKGLDGYLACYNTLHMTHCFNERKKMMFEA